MVNNSLTVLLYVPAGNKYSKSILLNTCRIVFYFSLIDLYRQLTISFTINLLVQASLSSGPSHLQVEPEISKTSLFLLTSQPTSPLAQPSPSSYKRSKNPNTTSSHPCS